MATDTTPAPMAVTGGDVLAARARLGTMVRRTPVIRIEADQLGGTHPACWLKLESLQVTGAFKARGALNNLLAQQVPAAGVVAASGGNHGQAVAWAARLLRVPAAIFVPTTCPPIKLRRLHDYGAQVTVIGEVYDQSLTSAEHYALQTGALLIHPFDQPLTVAGAGTLAAEFLDQVSDLDTVLVSVGGGGLLAGSLAALADTHTRVVGVEPVTARCLGAALDAGERVEVDVSGSAVDSWDHAGSARSASTQPGPYTPCASKSPTQPSATGKSPPGKNSGSGSRAAAPPRWRPCSAAPTKNCQCIDT